MLIDALLVGGRNALARRDHTEALRLDPERRVELAAEVFQRDRRGQFDDLLFAVMLFEAREQRIVDLLAGDRDALGVVERHPFLSLNSGLSRQSVSCATLASPSSLSITRMELMSIQNGQPLIAATRRLTSATSAFGNCPDCSIAAPSSFAARRIGG